MTWREEEAHRRDAVVGVQKTSEKRPQEALLLLPRGCRRLLMPKAGVVPPCWAHPYYCFQAFVASAEDGAEPPTQPYLVARQRRIQGSLGFQY